MQEQQEKEIVELRTKIEDYLQIKRTLEVHVNKHRIYEVRSRNTVGLSEYSCFKNHVISLLTKLFGVP